MRSPPLRASQLRKVGRSTQAASAGKRSIPISTEVDMSHLVRYICTNTIFRSLGCVTHKLKFNPVICAEDLPTTETRTSSRRTKNLKSWPPQPNTRMSPTANSTTNGPAPTTQTATSCKRPMTTNSRLAYHLSSTIYLRHPMALHCGF